MKTLSRDCRKFSTTALNDMTSNRTRCHQPSFTPVTWPGDGAIQTLQPSLFLLLFFEAFLIMNPAFSLLLVIVALFGNEGANFILSPC